MTFKLKVHSEDLLIFEKCPKQPHVSRDSKNIQFIHSFFQSLARLKTLEHFCRIKNFL